MRIKAKVHGEIQAKIQDNLFNFDKPPVADLLGTGNGVEQNPSMSTVDVMLSMDRLQSTPDPTPSIIFTPNIGVQGMPLQPRVIIIDPVDPDEEKLDREGQTGQLTPLEAWLQEEDWHVQEKKCKNANLTKFQQNQADIAQAQIEIQREREQL